MKKILIVHFSMEIGGAETSLVSMLHNIDYSEYDVSLFLLKHEGDLMAQIPKEVHIMDTPDKYRDLALPIKDVMKKGHLKMAKVRMNARKHGQGFENAGYTIKQYAHRDALKFLPDIPGEYDLAISFIDPHFIIGYKVNAKVKVGWFHTDFSRVDREVEIEKQMWDGCDYIVNVSDKCKESFDAGHPDLISKSLMIENMLSEKFLEARAEEFSVKEEMPDDGRIKILSIGRFCEAKNFDSVPEILKHIRESGINAVWYIIGYGGDEELIKQKIEEAGMQDNVIVLGKKANPYPYIKECDLYAQPSRYEGKCVAVIEAQLLHKPVVIANYATSSSQLIDGEDGIIVPLENEQCAQGIAALLQNSDKMKKIANNTYQHDYTNAGELEKIYQLME